MGATPKDTDAKVRLGYVEPKSVVWLDGREKLAGRDWEARKRELWERCGGKCEFIMPIFGGTAHVRCRQVANDPHHKIRRSVSRDDRLANLMALCRFHHDLLDERKVRSDRAERRVTA